ncbi:hypothetical protein [Haloarcula sp. K1]|uniref:hypothetical protein n=1 Tax=Haloarcula sp. K1 TaxID=1622207 RepID=UPI0012BA85F7|nr:hypothetical protein [Haloarcula sp. K1]
MIQHYIPSWNRVQRLLLIATAFGVIIHELAHKEMVEDFGLRVRDHCYFQLNNPSGYVIHDEPRGYFPTFAISTAPFFLNSAVTYTTFTIAGGMLTSRPIGSLSQLQVGGIIVLIWLGISSGVHAFPSSQDTKNIWNATKRRWWNPIAILGIPAIIFLLFLDKTKAIGSNYVFTAGIAYLSYRFLRFLFTSNSLGWF